MTEEWTLQTLYMHFSGLLTEHDKRYEDRFESIQRETRAALSAAEKAIQKAEIAVEKRFDSVNEFRGTLSDQAAQFLTRTEYESAHTSLEKTIIDLDKRVSKREDRGAGLNAGWIYLLAGIGAIGTLVTIFLYFNSVR